MRSQFSPGNYAELVAGIREGNPRAVASFRNTFTLGIQFFITRESTEIDVSSRVEEVVMAVIRDIKSGLIGSANIRSQILESTRRNLELYKLIRRSEECDLNIQPVSDLSHVAADLLRAMSEREREALKRYYVDREVENDICGALSMTPEEFRNLKHHLMKAWRQRTRISAQPTKNGHGRDASTDLLYGQP